MAPRVALASSTPQKMLFPFAWRCETSSSRPGFRKGHELISTERITLNIAVFAPIPKASVSTAATVKRGDFRMDRLPYRISRSNFSMEGHLMLSETRQRSR